MLALSCILRIEFILVPRLKKILFHVHQTIKVMPFKNKIFSACTLDTASQTSNVNLSASNLQESCAKGGGGTSSFWVI